MKNLAGSHLGESLQGKHNSCVMGRRDNNLNEIVLSGRWVCAHSTWRCWWQRHSPLPHPSSSPSRQTHPLSNSQINKAGNTRKISLPVEIFVYILDSAYIFLRLFLSVIKSIFGMSFPSMHPDQISHFPPYNFICFSSYVSILSSSLYYWLDHSGIHD